VSTRGQLLALAYPAPRAIAIADLPDPIYVRVITGAERDAWEQAIATESRGGRAVANVMGRFVALALSDERGARICTDADADALGAWPHARLRAVFEAAIAHNAMGIDDAAAEKKS
jgi:hypothetical protein